MEPIEDRERVEKLRQECQAFVDGSMGKYQTVNARTVLMSCQSMAGGLRKYVARLESGGGLNQEKKPGKTETERVRQYIASLREAVASCSGALTESERSGALGRLEAERLQVARVCLMLVLESLCKREGQPLSTTKWYETMPLRGEFRPAAAVFVRARQLEVPE